MGWVGYKKMQAQIVEKEYITGFDNYIDTVKTAIGEFDIYQTSDCKLVALKIEED